MAPQKVDKLITFEVAKLITLERPKGGQTNNSPAYIYIYTYIYMGQRPRSNVAFLVKNAFFPQFYSKNGLSKIRLKWDGFLKGHLWAFFVNFSVRVDYLVLFQNPERSEVSA